MSDNYLGEIAIFAFDFAPVDWMPCEGQLLPINSDNGPLFQVIGTQYGGDGKNNFALPDLRMAAPIGAGQNPRFSPRNVGDKVGDAEIALSGGQVGHTHRVVNKGALDPNNDKTNAPIATSTFGSLTIKTPGQPSVAEFSYVKGGNPRFALHPATVGKAGGGAAHENRQPFLALRYCICVNGTFPAVQIG
jgi:microcystin-dependent protein